MRSYSCCDPKSLHETPKKVSDLSALLRLVGEESRLKLLCTLKNCGEHCVCDIIEHEDKLSQSLASHHLADLKKAGLVQSRKDGLRVYYSLTPEGETLTGTVLGLLKKEGV